jgi:hypothetical protein
MAAGTASGVTRTPDGKDTTLTVGSVDLSWLAQAEAYAVGLASLVLMAAALVAQRARRSERIRCRVRSGPRMEGRRSRRDNRRPSEARMSRMW